jgi:hypothetical protein
MKNWNLPLIFCLCVAVGCTKAAIDPPPQEKGTLMRGVKGNNPTSVVIAQSGQDRCPAKVGQVVHFPFENWVTPPGPPTPLTTSRISFLKVEVNGIVVHEPEVFSPEVKPGSIHSELVYVFRPKSRGTYRVKVTAVNDRQEEEEARVCVIDVSG